MKYRIKPKGEWYHIQRLERVGLLKQQWNDVTRVSIFDQRLVLPMAPANKDLEEKMPTNNAQHALRVLDEIKKADIIVMQEGTSSEEDQQ